MMRNYGALKLIGCITAAMAMGILIQIFLPNILIIAVCCVLVVVMGIVIAKSL